MRTVPKVILSLLITIFLFSGLAVAAYVGLFNVLETRYYQPAVLSGMQKQLTAASDTMRSWHDANLQKLADFVNADAVKRSLLPNQSAQDIFDRTNLAGALMADNPGVSGIRIIDAGNGSTAEESLGKRRIHFSTFKDDILSKEDFKVTYENYGTQEADVPFDNISMQNGDNPKIAIDTARDCFLYCFPFYDSYTAWRGTIVFYVTARSAMQYLVSNNVFRLSDELDLLTDETHAVLGTVTGMPSSGKEILSKAILDRWSRHDFSADRIVSTDDSGWVLLTTQTASYGYTGQLVPESLFTFPKSVKILFLALSFLTIFLIVFLLFNLKQDEMVVIRNRIRRFQFQFLDEMVEQNEETRWDEMQKNLTARKREINSSIKKSFGRRLNKKYGETIDSLLNKSWEEMLAAMGHREEKQRASSDTEEIRQMLEQVLQNNAGLLTASGTSVVPRTRPSTAKKPVASGEPKEAVIPAPAPEEPEEIEEVEEIEPVEELEEVEEIEPVEELADAAEPEELEEVEDLAEVEEVEEVEELEEVEGLAEVEEVEEVEELEEVEDLAEVEDTEEPDEIEALEEIEPLAEVEEAEETEPAERLPEEEEVKPTEAPAEDVTEAAENEPEKIAESIPPIKTEEVEIAEFIGEYEEPEILEPATDDEAAGSVEDAVPDTILVYNFDEQAALDSSRDAVVSEPGEFDSFVVTGPDFSELDEEEDLQPELYATNTKNESDDSDDATEVDYIMTILPEYTTPITEHADNLPVRDYLEVVGEEEPEGLIPLTPDENESNENERDSSDNSSIINKDGLYLVADNPGHKYTGYIDPEFKELVDSVLE